MSIENQHPLYIEHSVLWEKVTDCISGETTIKNAGLKYLPKPSGMDEQEYNNYRDRAVFKMFTSETFDILYGHLFSKEPELKGNIEALRDIIENVDLTGTTLTQFSSDVVVSNLPTGWGGILVDHAPVPEGTNRADQERAGLTSYMRNYKAQDTDNWRYDTNNYRKVLAYVKLRETYEVPDEKDEFNSITKTRYRVLKLVDGVYVQNVWEQIKNGDKVEWVMVAEYKPMLDGKYLDFIPFFPCPSKEPEKSMLLPVTYLNLGSYRNSADYENLLHETGTPTCYAVGVEPPRDKDGNVLPVKRGGNTIMFIKGSGTESPRVGYLEPSGAGANSFDVAQKDKKDDVSVLTANIVKKNKAGVEAAETAKLQQAGGNSVLGSYSVDISGVITHAFRLCARWRGVPKEIADGFEISFAVDFNMDTNNIEARNIGLREVAEGVKSKKSYMIEDRGMDEKSALEELALIGGDKPDYSGFNLDLEVENEPTNP